MRRSHTSFIANISGSFLPRCLQKKPGGVRWGSTPWHPTSGNSRGHVSSRRGQDVQWGWDTEVAWGGCVCVCVCGCGGGVFVWCVCVWWVHVVLWGCVLCVVCVVGVVLWGVCSVWGCVCGVVCGLWGVWQGRCVYWVESWCQGKMRTRVGSEHNVKHLLESSKVSSWRVLVKLAFWENPSSYMWR